MDEMFDVIIIGSGPSGLTAGIYTSRANLKTLSLAGEKWGGQLMLTTEVENFPGFAGGIMGPVLIEEMRKQAEKFGTEIRMLLAESISKEEDGFVVSTREGEVRGRCVIVATGADAKWLEIPGEDKLRGRGVSSCATCDAAFFRNRRVMIVGGGDAAMEEALFMTKFTSEVLVVHRRDSFRASKIMVDRVLAHPGIKVVWESALVEYQGEKKLDFVQIETTRDRWNVDGEKYLGLAEGALIQEGSEKVLWRAKVDGVFVAIGHTPNTEFVKGMLELDTKNYIVPVTKMEEGREIIWFKEPGDIVKLRSAYPSMTNVEGVFVSGDVHDYHYRQAITAAGYGCMAAIDVERWLEEKFGIESNTQQW